ncbi:MAG TPA: response regulator, partial [Steroidobacteraceae bacterium]|nr:response regulator [Steroidobacteraceae bacterium]
PVIGSGGNDEAQRRAQMKADAMATRMSVLTRALPMKVLLVDDDELELELMADRLKSAGFEITCAKNGAEALAAVEQTWYPLVITDWQMPVMDGIQFTESLRSRGLTDTYVIMLTMREGSDDYERGYISGVDDYLTKKVPDAELFARIHAAFNTLALRRSLKETQNALQCSNIVDPESGAFTNAELVVRMHSEVRRAQRYGRQLCVITTGIAGLPPPSTRQFDPDRLRTLVQVLQSGIRAHVDWIGRVETFEGECFAVVLPEAGLSDAPVIKERLLNALRSFSDAQGLKLQFTFGLAALERGGFEGVAVDAREMIEVAENCRRCNGRIGTEQLGAVQRSVAGHVGISCRHGYAIDSECRLQSPGVLAAGTKSKPVNS